MAGEVDSKVKKIDSSTDNFTNENGYKIFCKSWLAQQTDANTDMDNQPTLSYSPTPRALIFIVHGVAEHCLPYEPIAKLLREKNFHVFSHDHQGHGQSEGSRVHINDFRHYTRDLFQHIDIRKKEYPDAPVYLVAHSMGGGVALLSAIDRPNYFAGLVLEGPISTPEQDSVSAAKIFFGKILARVVPNFPLLAIDQTLKSRDKTYVEQCKADPLIYHGSVKAKLCLCILNTVIEIESKMSTIKVPMFIMHGGDDKIVSPKSSESLHKEIASTDKTLKIYPDAYHQLHAEIEPTRTEVLTELVNWIDQRAPQ